MRQLNQRLDPLPGSVRRRTSLLKSFPDERLECVVIQWDRFPPSVLVQVADQPAEPIQFPGQKLPERDRALDRILTDFVDAASGKPFDREPFHADIVFSQRAFALLQPEPDLVLPAQALWECRAEALQALGIEDAVIS